MAEKLTSDELAQLRSLMAKASSVIDAPPPRPASMTPEQHADHVDAARALTAKHQAYDANPRDAHFALETRSAALEGSDVTPTSKKKKN